MCPLHPEAPSHHPPYPISPGYHRALPLGALCHTWNSHWLSILYMVCSTEWLHFYFSLSCIGEGNGNPLQCYCLENPRDWRAWWAAINGVTQSRTRLKWLSSSSSSSSSTPSPVTISSLHICFSIVCKLILLSVIFWQRSPLISRFSDPVVTSLAFSFCISDWSQHLSLFF